MASSNFLFDSKGSVWKAGLPISHPPLAPHKDVTESQLALTYQGNLHADSHPLPFSAPPAACL